MVLEILTWRTIHRRMQKASCVSNWNRKISRGCVGSFWSWNSSEERSTYKARIVESGRGNFQYFSTDSSSPTRDSPVCFPRSDYLMNQENVLTVPSPRVGSPIKGLFRKKTLGIDWFLDFVSFSRQQRLSLIITMLCRCDLFLRRCLNGITLSSWDGELAVGPCLLRGDGS